MSRYARQMQVPGVGAIGQARLTAAHVLIIGAGGLGCTVIPVLAAAGVGHLTIMDPDQVEMSNLHRQTLYRAADVGEPKAVAAAARATALNPDGQATAIVDRLDPANAPGLDKDLQVANEREKVLAQQQQVQAINNVADAIELNAMMAGPGYGPYGYGGWGY